MQEIPSASINHKDCGKSALISKLVLDFRAARQLLAIKELEKWS